MGCVFRICRGRLREGKAEGFECNFIMVAIVFFTHVGYERIDIRMCFAKMLAQTMGSQDSHL